MTKIVRDAMTPYPTCAPRSMSVTEAARAMLVEDVGSLPVVEGPRLVGMITDRDIVTRVVAAGLDPEQTAVGEVSSADPVCADPEQELDQALRLMAEHKIRRLPIVEDSLLVGILAQADVAMEAKEKRTGELVQEISQPSRGQDVSP